MGHRVRLGPPHHWRRWWRRRERGGSAPLAADGGVWMGGLWSSAWRGVWLRVWMSEWSGEWSGGTLTPHEADKRQSKESTRGGVQHTYLY